MKVRIRRLLLLFDCLARQPAVLIVCSAADKQTEEAQLVSLTGQLLLLKATTDSLVRQP